MTSKVIGLIQGSNELTLPAHEIEAPPTQSAGSSDDAPQCSVERRRRSLGALARAILLLWPRFIVAYVLVALLIYFCWPTIAALETQLASDLILALNPIPYLRELRWTETGYHYSDRILGQEGIAPLTSLLFIFGCPLGFALALPGLRTAGYWWRVFWASITSLGVCSALLAVGVDWGVAQRLGASGIVIHAPWYDRWLNVAIESDAIWDVTMDLYPLVACLLLARAAVTPRRTGFTPHRDRTRATARSRFIRGNFAALAGLLLLASAVELHALQQQEQSRKELFEALAERNPKLGKSLILFADSLTASGRHIDALSWYREASTYEGYTRIAKARIKRIRRLLERRWSPNLIRKRNGRGL